MTPLRRVLRSLPAGVLLVLSLGSGAAVAQEATVAEARIVDFAFEPVELTVPQGATVRWANAADRPHTVTDRGGTFDTGPIAPGGTGELAFDVPGRFSYFCRINPGRMNATVVVEPGEAPVGTTRVQAVDPARAGETLRFDPAALEVDAGSKVVFANVGGLPHTFTAEDGSFDTGTVAPGPEEGRFAGDNATVTVGQAGTVAFRCDVHPAVMSGTLTVREPARPPPQEAPAPVEVAAADFAFRPLEVAVPAGGTVAWTNTGAALHTVTFDDQPIDTGQIDPRGVATVGAPAEPGSYSYFCAVHPDRMRGVLVVLGDDVADPTAAAAQARGSPPTSAVGQGEAAAPAPAADEDGSVPVAVLAAAVVGAFLGGFVLSALVRRSPEPAAEGAPAPQE